MANGFTRQEAIALTGINSNRLSYLDRTGVVVPEKFGDSTHPTVIYSWQQIIQVKVLHKLKSKLSSQEIHSVATFVKNLNYEPFLFKCHFLLLNQRLYFFRNADDFLNAVLDASSSNNGQLVIHNLGSLTELILELHNEANVHRVLDFEKRVNGTPIALPAPGIE